jgi:hypothetical protein
LCRCLVNSGRCAAGGQRQDSDSEKAQPIFPGMLCMRPKPPSGLETVNSGQPWSAEDIADLRGFLEQDVPIGAIAEFLWRTAPEVRAKANEINAKAAELQ